MTRYHAHRPPGIARRALRALGVVVVSVLGAIAIYAVLVLALTVGAIEGRP